MLSINHVKAAEEIYGSLEEGTPPTKKLAEELYEEYVGPYYDDSVELVKKSMQGAILTHLLVDDGERTARILGEIADFGLMEETVTEFGDSPTFLQLQEIYAKLTRYAISIVKEEVG
jgi:hypothetical protein